jgi:hypothetical protein
MVRLFVRAAVEGDAVADQEMGEDSSRAIAIEFKNVSAVAGGRLWGDVFFSYLRYCCYGYYCL